MNRTYRNWPGVHKVFVSTHFLIGASTLASNCISSLGLDDWNLKLWIFFYLPRKHFHSARILCHLVGHLGIKHGLVPVLLNVSKRKCSGKFVLRRRRFCNRVDELLGNTDFALLLLVGDSFLFPLFADLVFGLFVCIGFGSFSRLFASAVPNLAFGIELIVTLIFGI